MPLVAETGQTIVSPPQSSGVRPRSCSCFFTAIEVRARQIDLVDATMIFTCGAALA